MDKKRGCYGCVHADWDADGCTCKLDGLNVWNAAKGCKYRKEKAVTNGDKIRAMSDEELAEWLDSVIGCCSLNDCSLCRMNGACDDVPISMIKWLKKEAT